MSEPTLHERLNKVAEVFPDVHKFALAFLIGAAEANPDLRVRIEGAVDYVERTFGHD